MIQLDPRFRQEILDFGMSKEWTNVYESLVRQRLAIGIVTSRESAYAEALNLARLLIDSEQELYDHIGLDDESLAGEDKTNHAKLMICVKKYYNRRWRLKYLPMNTTCLRLYLYRLAELTVKLCLMTSRQ